MFCYILGEAAVDELFYSRFTFKLSTFLGFFQHGSGSSVKAIMPLSATLPLAIGLKIFLISNSIIQSQRYLDYLSSILKIFAYQTSFREDFDKCVLSVHI